MSKNAKGLEVTGTFSRKNNQVVMEMTITNRAMQPMSGFAIQFNKNRCVCGPVSVGFK